MNINPKIVSFMEKHVKPSLCYEGRWFADLTYPLYSDLDCVCCAFLRGAAIMFLPAFVLGAVLS